MERKVGTRVSEAVISHTQSPEIDKLVIDLLLAQKAFPSIPKNGNNPHFGSSYATLADTIAATRGILNDHSIVISQWPVRGGLKTRLLHVSGQWIAEEMDLCGQTTPQGQGSALTYAKRYAWQSILGLDTDDDDDGNAAQAQATTRQAPPAQQQPRQQASQAPRSNSGGQRRSNQDGPPEPSPGCSIKLGGKNPITEGQGRALFAICKDKGFKLSDFIAMHTNGKAEDQLTSWEASQLIEGLNDGRLSTDTAVSTVGIEQVAEQFPGAQVIGHPEEQQGYGFSDQEF